MHSVSPVRRRSSSAIRSSILAAQDAERRDQSRRLGTRLGSSLAELGADLGEREPDPLREDDERDAAEHVPLVATLAASSPFGADQASVLVEAKRRGGDAAALRETSPIVRGADIPETVAEIALDFKLT